MVERDLILFLPHEVIGGFVALARTDRFTERDPGVVERVFARETEFVADRALEELDRFVGRATALMEHGVLLPNPTLFFSYKNVITGSASPSFYNFGSNTTPKHVRRPTPLLPTLMPIKRP